MKKTELTNAELGRLDFVHNEIYALINRLVPNSLAPPDYPVVKWDMEIIGEIADTISAYLAAKKICTEQEFMPFIEI